MRPTPHRPHPEQIARPALIDASNTPFSLRLRAAVEEAERALSWTSVAILGIFALEQAARLAVFGPRYFLHLWHALDAVVIVSSLVLECVLRGVAQETVSLLIVFRLWRLVRVMHGVAEAVAADAETELGRHHGAEQRLERQLEEERRAVAQLKALLKERGGGKEHPR